MHHDTRTISLRYCIAVIEVHIALIVAFRSLPLFGLVSLMLGLMNEVQVRGLCWPFKNRNTMVNETAVGTFGSVGSCQVLLDKKLIISI